MAAYAQSFEHDGELSYPPIAPGFINVMMMISTP